MSYKYRSYCFRKYVENSVPIRTDRMLIHIKKLLFHFAYCIPIYSISIRIILALCADLKDVNIPISAISRHRHICKKIINVTLGWVWLPFLVVSHFTTLEMTFYLSKDLTSSMKVTFVASYAIWSGKDFRPYFTRVIWKVKYISIHGQLPFLDLHMMNVLYHSKIYIRSYYEVST